MVGILLPYTDLCRAEIARSVSHNTTMLPFEDRGYRAKESIEYVLWEQIRRFDTYVKNAEWASRDPKGHILGMSYGSLRFPYKALLSCSENTGTGQQKEISDAPSAR